jgi:hypothetical protein
MTVKAVERGALAQYTGVTQASKVKRLLDERGPSLRPLEQSYR